MVRLQQKNEEDLKLKIVAYYEGISINNITFSELIERVKNEYEAKNQADTGLRHKQIFNQYFNSLSKIQVNKITSNIINNLLNELIKNGIKKQGFINAKTTLRMLYRCAKNNKIDCIDIIKILDDFVPNFKGEHIYIQDNRRTKNLVFTKEETEILIKYAIQNPTYKSLFLALILTTGCRAGELLCMSYDNIDLEERLFYVEKIENRNHIIKSYTKNNKSRQVYLNNNAIKLLNLLLELRKKDNFDSQFLFLNSESKDNKLHIGAEDGFVRNIQKILNFDCSKELRSLHDGRRTYATLQYLSGVNLKSIQRQLGHSSVRQTEEYIFDTVDLKYRGNDLEKGNLEI
ncbi:MAG: site-specific integrase [Lachnospiraceae bacterium]|nr:site-specific integrase [Lachnospiraceae bacterium]